MSATPAFLDSNRPDVPDIVVPRGVTPFHLPGRPSAAASSASARSPTPC